MKVDDSIQAYINLRDKLAEIKKAYTERSSSLKDAMSKIEMDILEYLQESGQESAKTKFGTAYKTTSTSVTVEDGKEFFDFVMDVGAIDLLERRVNKTAYKNYIEDGMDVPGVRVYSENKVVIRRR